MVRPPGKADKPKWPKAEGLDVVWRNELVINPRSTSTEDMIDIGSLKESELADLLVEFASAIKRVRTTRWRLRQYVLDSRKVLDRIERLNATKWARDLGMHQADIEKHTKKTG